MIWPSSILYLRYFYRLSRLIILHINFSLYQKLTQLYLLHQVSLYFRLFLHNIHKLLATSFLTWPKLRTFSLAILFCPTCAHNQFHVVFHYHFPKMVHSVAKWTLRCNQSLFSHWRIYVTCIYVIVYFVTKFYAGVLIR